MNFSTDPGGAAFWSKIEPKKLRGALKNEPYLIFGETKPLSIPLHTLGPSILQVPIPHQLLEWRYEKPQNDCVSSTSVNDLYGIFVSSL